MLELRRCGTPSRDIAQGDNRQESNNVRESGVDEEIPLVNKEPDLVS